MNIQQILNSPFAVRFLARIAGAVPPGIGYPLAERIGGWIAARRQAKLTQAVRVNQWMARGASLEKGELERVVQETLQNNARDIYSLYHYLHRPDVLQTMICLSPSAIGVVGRPEFSERGLVILGLHLSSFDLVLRSIISQRQFKAMVLTIPDPEGGRRVEFEMRRQTGMHLVPASVSSLRAAIRHLERGGMVISGLDRPIPTPKQQPVFFGQPASLPIFYVTLASKARVPVVVMAAIQEADRKYHVFSSAPIEMEPDRDSEKATLRNAERVLKEAEGFIRLAPQQWNVPLPVWPQFLART